MGWSIIILFIETGIYALRVIDKLVLDAFSESKPMRVLFDKNKWAR